jgi:spectinomycin phosphotransferase
MLEKPDLADDKIIQRLREAYELPAADLEFLPIGNDSSAWVYRIQTDEGTPYFLKVKKGAIYEPSLSIPRYLKGIGIEQIVAPLPTQKQQLWTSLDNFTLILYPFIDGRAAMEIGMSDHHWVEFGDALRRIHTTQLPDSHLRLIRRETFTLKWDAVLHQLREGLREETFDDSFQREIATFWKSRQNEIERIVERTKTLGRLLRSQPQGFVLCHADIHTFNVLIDEQSKMHIVDWDETLLAPKERDLVFLKGAFEGTSDSAKAEVLFFEGYGQTDVDPVAIAYYRYEWVVQEIADFGQRIFLTTELGEATRHDAVRGFMQLFDPGDVVDEAYESELDLPKELRWKM